MLYLGKDKCKHNNVTALPLAVSCLDRLHGLPILDVSLFLCLD